ncbi:MAG: hypothetical protein HUJ56_07145, partial [Erysipelotrichaceae bacterium]|nr:hypothetical protein [Erysipelotrichaceae bacterium]
MIRIKNNSGGYLSLYLDDYTGVKPSRWFIMPTADSEVAIPAEYESQV